MGDEGWVERDLRRARELTEQIDARYVAYISDIKPLAEERTRLLRRLRHERKLTLRELAEETGISIQRIREIIGEPPETPETSTASGDAAPG